MAKDAINAFLGAETSYTGSLKFDGAVRIDGKYNGDITSDGALIVGKEAWIEGNIHVGEMMLAGYFKGNAFTSQRTIIHRTGHLEGSLRTPVLNVEEGARIDAEIHTDSPDRQSTEVVSKKSLK